MKKGFTLIELLVVTAILMALFLGVLLVVAKPADACFLGFGSDCASPKPQNFKEESVNLTENQRRLLLAVPAPRLQTSQERLNISRRAEIFSSEDKISYIYLVNYGKVMAFYTVKGKVSSLRSYMTPQEKLVRYDGSDCGYKYSPECYIVQAPDIDGSYGDNADGIFFFTTEGAYVEWVGDYMMSDQPLKLTTQPELVRTIQ